MKKTYKCSANSSQPSAHLRTLIEHVISELEEQNALGGGAVPGTSAAGAFSKKDFRGPQEDARPEDFGEILFGDERGLPQGEPEENTGIESDLASDLYLHYHGGMPALNKWVDRLSELEANGHFTDFLSVPDRYKYAYRALSLSTEQMTNIFGSKFTKRTGSDTNLHAITGKFLMPGTFEGRFHFSWTVGISGLEQLAKDWYVIHSRHMKRPWLVFVRAPISSNRFLLNPDETMPFSEEFHEQKEIISVGDVFCDKALYVLAETGEVMTAGQNSEGEKRALKNLSRVKEQHIGTSPTVVKITCPKGTDRTSLEVIKDFLRFCHKKLDIANFPHMRFHATKQPNMTTGAYHMEDNAIDVLVGDRLLADILRTIAHELTHRKQHESGVLDRELAKQDPMDEMGDLNTIYENEAYEKSGNFVKEFARLQGKDPAIKEKIYSLYESVAYPLRKTRTA